jgi:glycosyltransferase involved in cell wall biosynthesis
VNKKDLLTVGYSTLGNRLTNIKYLESFSNLVVIQNPNSESLPATDSAVKRVELKSRGVAKSRNAVIENTTTEYLLFGDDDIEFKEESINSAITYLESNPDISILLLQAVDETGTLRKPYPKQAHSLKLTNSAKAATYEMIIRVSDIKKASIRFDENFGAGAENYLGDEYIFIADALRAGLKGYFLPIVIATHPTDSSGSFHNTKQDAIVRSRIFSRVFGIWAPIMRLLFILKPPSKKFGLRNSISFLIGRS